MFFVWKVVGFVERFFVFIYILWIVYKEFYWENWLYWIFEIGMFSMFWYVFSVFFRFEFKGISGNFFKKLIGWGFDWYCWFKWSLEELWFLFFGEWEKDCLVLLLWLLVEFLWDMLYIYVLMNFWLSVLLCNFNKGIFGDGFYWGEWVLFVVF